MSERTRLLIHQARHKEPDDLDLIILEILEVQMAAIDDLAAQFNDLGNVVNEYIAAVGTAFTNLEAEVAKLKQELIDAGVDPTKLAALEQAMADEKTAVATGEAAVAAADPGPQDTPPPPAPAEGAPVGETPAPASETPQDA